MLTKDLLRLEFVIGAGAVVLNDVPDNSIVVGMPAKVVKQNINPKDFY